jgi:hypothetical protein
MIQLDLHDLSWINDAVDDPNDYCAHGTVALTVSGVVWISPEELSGRFPPPDWSYQDAD